MVPLSNLKHIYISSVILVRVTGVGMEAYAFVAVTLFHTDFLSWFLTALVFKNLRTFSPEVRHPGLFIPEA